MLRRPLALLPLLIAASLVGHSTTLLSAEPATWKPVADFIQLPSGMTLGACSAAAVNSKGELYVYHRGAQPILVFAADGKLLRSWGSDLIASSHGLRLDAKENVWVTDIGNHRVYQFDPNGKLLMTLGNGKPGVEPDQFDKPTDVNFGPGGEIYVTDGYGNSRVQKFSPSGALLQSWGTKGTKPGEFRTPHVIVIDKQGRLLVGDRENDRIQIFSNEGKLLDVWNGYAPYGLALVRDGAVFVSDGRANEVLQLDEQGKIVQRFGKKGSAAGEFDLPHMLAFDPAGNLFVTEILGKRVQKFTRP